ncbi:hypothetical protein LSTR_LSTR010117 [Laodelphax striatellus]|uniref:Membrane dipeptidase n=1 Tax=Laodelphax striatellus TaxID=195883 RepID=A0A482WJU0_LAOST|nr:hypothetical protein LSTR_LSTR010117 [Laodelphax striatellus]
MEDPSWTDEQLKKLAGLNFLRVFSTAEQVRDKWKDDGLGTVEDLFVASAQVLPPSDCVYEGS